MKIVTTAEMLNQYSIETLLDNQRFQFIDVRTPSEFQHEHIQSAVNVPLQNLADLSSQALSQKTAIFYCASGNRTEINKSLIEQTPFKEKYILKGGITGWKQANLPTTKLAKAPIDVMRQVQLIVSIMIFLGVVLSYTVSHYFILLTVFAGLGLFVAGTTGFCGMANLLKCCPWNKSK